MEDQKAPATQKPPTKLRNPKLFKPFEMYVKMYGLPAYNEMDPTWFVAITYSFIFGAMFGDVGQGLVLFLGGLFLYKTKKMDLAGIISCAGVFSVFFGFMYGSFFGFEDVLKAIWLKPMNQMMDVPLVGRLNAVFVIAIGFGMFIILICMVFNIINSIRRGDTEKTWFDSNAVAGLVFYGSIVLTIGLFISGKKLPAAAILVIMYGVPLLLMFLKEPLTNLVEKKSKILPEQKGMFFVQLPFQHTFFPAYRRICSQPRSYDGSCTDACRRYQWRQPELDRSRSWKHLRVCHGRSDRRYPGSSSGILRDLQPFLCR